MRADVSEFVKDCEACDRDRCSNPAPRASLGHFPADRFFAAFYIELLGGQGSLSLGASLKFILTMIDGLTICAEATPISDQSAATVTRVIHSE